MRALSVSLRSGSSGNATFVRTPSARLAVDVGLSGRRFADALESIGEHADDIDAILLTHEHADHCSGLGVVMRRHRIPLYVTRWTYREVKGMLGRVDESLIHFIEAGTPFAVRDTVITPFSTPHDAIDPLGFRIHTDDGDIGIATDLGYFSDDVRAALSGCKIVHLEANFDPEMLETGSYPRHLKRRIASREGHLSNFDAGAAAVDLLRHGTEAFALSHLSEENNRPYLALSTVMDTLAREGAKVGRDYIIKASPRYTCAEPFCFAREHPPLAPRAIAGTQQSFLPDDDAGEVVG
jgi:phosphoribosyl 1,2-cyclic phosphodiesterase